MSPNTKRRLKNLARPVLRPVYQLGQKIAQRMMRSTILSLQNEISELRTVLQSAQNSKATFLAGHRKHRPFAFQELTTTAQLAARERLGIAEDHFLILFPNQIHTPWTALECLNAFEQLRYWNVNAVLHFACPIPLHCRPAIEGCVCDLGLAETVHFPVELKESVYRDLVIAADCGLELDADFRGLFSGPLLDCLSAGLPTVCRQELFEAADCPSFVHTLPERLSPFLIAEKLLEIGEQAETNRGEESFRTGNAIEHQQTNYSPQILKLLAAA